MDVYAPKARDDTSNLLNQTIKEFGVAGVDTHEADHALFRMLAHQLTPRRSVVGNLAIGQWGPTKISVHMRNAKVYEILNAIVAQNGRAIWTVLKPPEKLSTEVGDLWHIYPIDPPFKDGVLAQLSAISH